MDCNPDTQIALFSAVLTAFVVPATQNLFPSSNNSPGNPTDSPPPVPKTSAQDVCILYYLAENSDLGCRSLENDSYVTLLVKSWLNAGWAISSKDSTSCYCGPSGSS
ncbi:hypothetical protein SISSUDRAFT_1054518 [Sistotremastrum suecicum HHB10207 ss-3]|uniref:DUF6535 domain-containing protein n=1 Tax=Sistotremastrum suecicum HHB10207 ss-3 TaxID=1314776 RepID=A0A165YFT5_9AGAM|nr:hypothetical protein SISSUDRAFT_1054518 [Sistotremastrum suecicum HHB10207 ss-3]